MDTNNFIRIIVLFFLIIENKSTKVWQSNQVSISNTIEILEHNGCSANSLIFPKDFNSVVEIGGKTLKIGAVFLPDNGAVILNSNSKLIFEDPTDQHSKCTEDVHVPKKSDKVRYWFDPSNWNSTSISDLNFTPHMERIPCEYDMVYIPHVDDSQIDLEDTSELNMYGMLISNDLPTEREMNNFLQSDLGGFMFSSTFDTKFKYFKNARYCSCHSSTKYVSYYEHVCSHVNGTCDVPKCVDPILPLGHCCFICGSVLNLKLDRNEKCQETLHKVKKVNAEISQMRIHKSVIFHTSVYDTGNYLELQIIGMPKPGTEGDHLQFIKDLNETLQNIPEIPRRVQRKIISSGQSYSSSLLTSGSMISLLTLLAVAVVFVIIYIHYVPDNRLHFRFWLRSQYRGEPSRMLFRRFDQELVEELRPGNSMLEEIVEEVPADQEHINAFDNPMFTEATVSPGDEVANREECKKTSEENMTEIDLVSLKGE